MLNAYKAVKAGKGAGGVDGVELEEFDKDWKNRLYKLWNRMSSGAYFPKLVRGVEIPKKNGKKSQMTMPANGMMNLKCSCKVLKMENK